MIRKGYDPITESAYLYCDECGMTFPWDVEVEFHVCDATTEDEPTEQDPLGARGGAM